MNLRSRSIPIRCAAATAALLLAGCTRSASPPAGGPPAATASGPTHTVPGGSNIPLSIGQTRLGAIVVGPGGRTLYRFDQDSAMPPKSNCTGTCANTWIPLAGNPAEVNLTGVDPSLLGALTRADGTPQLALAGWPLYLYTGDKKAGDLNGQGQGGVWHAVTANGEPVTASAATTSTSAGG